MRNFWNEIKLALFVTLTLIATGYGYMYLLAYIGERI